ncbi:hypothetical protein DERF_000599, partial [Dermatophagoides farinae]
KNLFFPDEFATRQHLINQLLMNQFAMRQLLMDQFAMRQLLMDQFATRQHLINQLLMDQVAMKQRLMDQFSMKQLLSDQVAMRQLLMDQFAMRQLLVYSISLLYLLYQILNPLNFPTPNLSKFSINCHLPPSSRRATFSRASASVTSFEYSVSTCSFKNDFISFSLAKASLSIFRYLRQLLNLLIP